MVNRERLFLSENSHQSHSSVGVRGSRDLEPGPNASGQPVSKGGTPIHFQRLVKIPSIKIIHVEECFTLSFKINWLQYVLSRDE